jgi:hypothetical protein
MKTPKSPGQDDVWDAISCSAPESESDVTLMLRRSAGNYARQIIGVIRR